MDVEFRKSCTRIAMDQAFLPYRWPAIFPPTPTPHTLLDMPPNSLDYLPVPPPSLRPLRLIPLLNLRARNPPAPTFHRTRYFLSSPSHIDTQGVSEQIGRSLPFVAFELPRLTRGEDSHNARPVVRFELLRSVDKDESERTLRVDGGEQAGDVEDVC